jgi:hypothetical protein
MSRVVSSSYAGFAWLHDIATTLTHQVAILDCHLVDIEVFPDRRIIDFVGIPSDNARDRDRCAWSEFFLTTGRPRWPQMTEKIGQSDRLSAGVTKNRRKSAKMPHHSSIWLWVVRQQSWE